MPTIPEALALALQHHQAGRLQAAEHGYRQILGADPNQADATYLLGVMASQMGKLDLAVDYFRRAIERKEGSAEFHHSLAKAYHTQRRMPEALSCYQRAVELKPGYAEAHYNRGTAFVEVGKLVEAVDSYREALKLKPDFAEAQVNLGNVLAHQGALEDAVSCFRRAVELRPNLADAHNNLGSGLMDLGLAEEASDCFRQALTLQPSFPEAHHNLGMYLLLVGRYEEGWREYEHRLAGATEPKRFSQPRWNGESLAGRTILIHAEQGFGDTLQFARYAALVRERTGARRAILLPQPELARLLAQQSQLEVEIPAVLSAAPDSLPPFDCHVPLLSLPLALGLSEPLPRPGGYLDADPALRRQWRERLGAPALRVGLAWAGNPEKSSDRLRSIPQEKLLPLLRAAGIEFYSLQVGVGQNAPPAWRDTGLIDLTAHMTDFAETAAFVAELDLVISVDTAVAHLAGAMGKPVWTLVPFAPDWRWGLQSESTPWYPTMRLFRQSSAGDWDSVVERICEESEGLVK